MRKEKRAEANIRLGEVEELGMLGLLAKPPTELFSYLLLHHKGTWVFWLKVRGIATKFPWEDCEWTKELEGIVTCTLKKNKEPSQTN